MDRKNNGSRSRVRYAVAGLGYTSQAAVLPAFAHADNSELRALITSDPDKASELGRKYRISNIFGYGNYEEYLRSGDVDAIYIAEPNHLHREFTVRSARAGVHVLCEKPMAVTAPECEEMISVCRESGVLLMIAYRLHFEEANLEAIRIGRSGELGDLRIFNSVFSQQVVKGSVRVEQSIPAGRGTLYDMGVYCINAARYLFRDEPVEVSALSAASADERFQNIDEMTSAVLRFPEERLASFTSSFGAAPVSEYQLVGTRGSLKVHSAYEFTEPIRHTLTLGDGKPKVREFPKRDQFAQELIYFSDCIRSGREPEPSGVEGLADVRIIEALYKSAMTQTAVRLGPFEKQRYASRNQQITRPPVSELDLVHAESPSGR
ncbi:MAG TPA: Gfo/Idh/MocA family oxidoreductase [Bryobacteraceae bacterium]|nr:Gfo/Idh/MocA family oxidoreductase [Bryobacteraceae bacterium]